ncbi:MAG: tRNA lysidine(34) synthetase TilS [Marinifilaceae bacterium]
MIRAFLKFIEEQELFYRDEKILLAVSGGVDSMVMLDLFYRAHVDCVIAHCNFNLRGEESDGDEALVIQKAEEYGFPVFVKCFATRNEAAANGISVEMAARDLRYNWFEELRMEQHCHYIAVAHHSDDVAETLLINLCRGTGIRGLTGIKAKAGKVVRPLLNFSRPQLEEYSRTHDLVYREDSTNAELDFVRNKIRNQVLPVLEEINPGIRQTMMENIRHFKEVEQIYLESVSKQKDDLVTAEGEQLKISISKLKALSAPATYLYEILSPYNFPSKDVRNIAKALDAISGKVFYSSSHRLIRDREFLLLQPLKNIEDREFLIRESDFELLEPIKFRIERFEKSSDFSFSRDKNICCLDAEKLQFPLILRKWKQGDSFQPIGMKGRKKISDFFIDQKFSLEQKENTWLLVSGEDIVWVVGHRMDDRYKITPQAQRICMIEWIESKK